MVTKESMKRGKKKGILCSPLKLRLADIEKGGFSRADLVFHGVDHSDISYEVRVFLNNPDASEKTPRSKEHGYAGRFVIFGHGGCYGSEGHCDLPTQSKGQFDLRRPHPLTPQTKLLPVTEPLRRILEQDSKGLDSVTLVPISQNPLREDRRLTDKLFKFTGMELRTYR